MSEYETTVEGYDPYDTPVNAGPKTRYYRMSNGRITWWNKEAQEEEVIPELKGEIERIGEYFDSMSAAKGFPSEMIELVLMDRDGTRHVVQVRQASKVSVVHLAGYLDNIGKGRVIALTARPGDNKVTFPEVHTFDGMKWVRAHRVVYGENAAEALPHAMEALRGHLAWGDKPAKRQSQADFDDAPNRTEDDKTLLLSFADKNGWLPVEEAEAEWTSLINKAAGSKIKGTVQATPAQWRTLRISLMGRAQPGVEPKTLAERRAKLQSQLDTAAPPRDALDPFADE